MLRHKGIRLGCSVVSCDLFFFMSAFIFLLDIEVEPQDLDELNHVNNVVYLRWVQEAAAAHWNSAADPEVRKKFSWVVLRHEIDYKKPAKLHDHIQARTWVSNYDGARSTRMVQLIRKSDQVLLAEARTTWCLLDANSGRPVRIGHEIKSVFAESDGK